MTRRAHAMAVLLCAVACTTAPTPTPPDEDTTECSKRLECANVGQCVPRRDAEGELECVATPDSCAHVAACERLGNCTVHEGRCVVGTHRVPPRVIPDRDALSSKRAPAFVDLWAERARWFIPSHISASELVEHLTLLIAESAPQSVIESCDLGELFRLNPLPSDPPAFIVSRSKDIVIFMVATEYWAWLDPPPSGRCSSTLQFAVVMATKRAPRWHLELIDIYQTTALRGAGRHEMRLAWATEPTSLSHPTFDTRLAYTVNQTRHPGEHVPADSWDVLHTMRREFTLYMDTDEDTHVGLETGVRHTVVAQNDATAEALYTEGYPTYDVDPWNCAVEHSLDAGGVTVGDSGRRLEARQLLHRTCSRPVDQ